MFAYLDNAAVLHHYDAVGLLHCGQAVGDDEGGAALHGTLQGGLHHLLALRVWALPFRPCYACCTRTHASAVAGKGDEVIMPAVITAGTGKAVGEYAASQIPFERIEAP